MALPLLIFIELMYLSSSFYLAQRYGQWSYDGEILRSGLRIISIAILLRHHRQRLLNGNGRIRLADVCNRVFAGNVLFLLGFAAFYTSAGNESISWQALFFVSGLLAGLREELFYRGIVLEELQKKFQIRPALLLTSVIFACAHVQFLFYQQYFALLLIFFAGIIFGCIYIKTGNVYFTGIVHALYDAVLSLQLLPFRLSDGAGLVILLLITAVFLWQIKSQLMSIRKS